LTFKNHNESVKNALEEFERQLWGLST